MTGKRSYTAIGLMSGTSRDGIDVALLRGDGVHIHEIGEAISLAYEDAFRRRIADAIEKVREIGRPKAGDDLVSALERDLTQRHIDAVTSLLEKASLDRNEVDLIGFHGHTLLHDPENHTTWQMGDAQWMANVLDIPVIGDFRRADMAAGGEGAPLAPAYHLARLRGQIKNGRYAIINIGGVSNITVIDLTENDRAEERLSAFDCGPGNALIDDWVSRHCGLPFDKDGATASKGVVDKACLKRLMSHPFFKKEPPKSLDRDDFSIACCDGLSAEDGAATLTAFTIAAIEDALRHLPRPVDECFITGGGRHNGFMMRRLSEKLECPVKPVEALGWRGDFVEAEAFAHLAICTKKEIPFSWPGTTGCAHPVVGGHPFMPA